MNSNKFIKIDSFDEWRTLLGKVKFKTFFHETEWESFLEKEFEWINFEHFVYDNNVLVSFASINKGSSRYVSHPFSEYGGPMPLGPVIDLREFKKDLIRAFGESLKMNIHPKALEYFSNISTPKEEGAGLISYWVDWRNKEKDLMIHEVRKTLRHSLDRLNEENILIATCSDKDELQQFYRQYLFNMREKLNLSLPMSFFNFFFNNSKVDIVLAKKEDKVIGGSIFLNYGDFCHYFINAVDVDDNPSALILFEKIKNVSAEGKIMDLGGTREGSSLETFKQAWHGEKKNIIQIGETNGAMRNSSMRKLWKYLPIGLVPIISKGLYPKII